MQLITPNQLGHHPAGTPISSDGSYAGAISDDALDNYSDTPDLEAYKEQVRDVQGDASAYYLRNRNALGWWGSVWPGQTIDGRKWYSEDDNPDSIFPWPGASDTRTRTVKMVVNEHRTIGSYALMNMKLQARSTRPTVQGEESGQATTLLNWQLFNQLQAEWHRESKLALAWRNGYGAAVIRVCWSQERRIDQVTITVDQFGLWVRLITKSPQLQPQDILEMLSSKDYEKDMLQLIQAMSPIVDNGKARTILAALRQQKPAQIPIPYVFKSQPQITTLRPMVDVFWPVDTADLQRARFIDEVERVSEPELYDRIETENYDPDFVKQACTHKGDTVNQPWVNQTEVERNIYGQNSWRAQRAHQHLIELHHFWHLSYDMDAPVLCKTVFHNEVDIAATHGPSEYEHGEMPFHDLRFERDDRPILSSMGICEIAYTWEQEYKVQVDARTDRTSFANSPPLFTDHPDVLKMKKAWMPKTIIPMRRGSEPRFAQPPQYDPGSTQITIDIERRIDRYFGLFGAEVDPDLKKMRRDEVVDDLLAEMKPVFAQMFKLDQQYLPDAEVSAIVGQLSRPFQVSRKEIQDAHEILATVDLRNLDQDWVTTKAQGIAQILGLDTTGNINRTPVIRNLFEALDYNLADQALVSNDQAAEREQSDEMEKVSLIIGSGVEQKLPPPGSNFNLRLQTLQGVLQSNPLIKQRLAQAPDVVKILENRYLYLQRQIQQQANGIIGKTQVGSALNPQQPPMIDSPMTANAAAA